MTKKMNAVLFLAGLIFIALALWPKPAVSNNPKPPEPWDGQIQIRQQGDKIWVYHYVEAPGWRVKRSAASMEDALREKSIVDNLHAEERVIQ